MRLVLLKFDSKYYEYGRIENLLDKGILIRAYEGAYFMDLVVTFVFSKTTYLFEASTLYMETFQDDSLQV